MCFLASLPEKDTKRFSGAGDCTLACFPRKASVARHPTQKPVSDQWRQRHSEMWRRHELEGAARFSHTHQCHGVPAHSSRSLDSIDLVWAMSVKDRAKDSSVPEVRVMDLSQNCWRTATIGHGMPTLTTSSDLFCFPRDRVITPWEHMLAMGWGREAAICPGLSPGQIRDLAGESMSVPNIAAILIALLHTLVSSGALPASDKT